MIFEDGEVCSQKSGRLLWLRSLHCLSSGFTNLPPMVFPEKMGGKNPHSFIFVDISGSYILRAEMRKLSEHIAKAIDSTAGSLEDAGGTAL